MLAGGQWRDADRFSPVVGKNSSQVAFDGWKDGVLDGGMCVARWM